MECPKCGFLLIDERWICENCGAEIQMVPDFEPELEESISEVLLNVAEEINPPQSIKQEAEKVEKVNQISPVKPPVNEGINNFKRYLIISMAAVVFIGIIIPVSLFIYRNNSVTYQLGQARLYEEQGDYANAILRVEKANNIRPFDAEIRLLWAAYHFSNGDYDKAVELLLEMIESPRFTWAEKDICYDNIIFIWDLMDKHQEISDLVRASRDENLINEYRYFLSWPPLFSEESGTFTGSLSLSLSSEARGRIFYTLNGSEPNVNSYLYTAPLVLGAGEYYVTAVFENEFGVLSDLVTGHFVIEIQAPSPPVVPLTSGRYIVQTMIVVEVPEGYEVFFTVDGSDPTVDSELYVGPIAMALGNTVYKFIAVNPEGIASEIVSREFEFRINSDISLDMAVENVFRAQISRGRITDMTGKAVSESGYYDYVIDSLIEITDKGLYYMIYEYYSEGDDELQRTGHIFAANAYTGEAAHLIYNELGILDAIKI